MNQGGRLSSFRLHPSSFAQGSSSPFLPFFFAGSASRGRVTGGAGAVSTFGAGVSVRGCGSAGRSSALGGGGKVICSSFGSVVVVGVVSSSSDSSSSSILN